LQSSNDWHLPEEVDSNQRDSSEENGKVVDFFKHANNAMAEEDKNASIEGQ
jgi:hypothetical protein